MKPKVLLVGEHPHGITGNCNMMMELLNRADHSKFDITVYAGTKGLINNEFKEKIPCELIEGGLPGKEFIKDDLVSYLNSVKYLDSIIFVGIDIWMYQDIAETIINNRQRLGFKWASIFPYDLISVRKDYAELLNLMDFPCVYSKYGYNLLKDHVKNLRYFRPPLYKSNLFKPRTQEERRRRKKDTYQIIPDDSFIFGFFGVNQLRKDPQRLIKAFFELKKELPNIFLYLHTEIGNGVYNIGQYLDDCGKQYGDVFIKGQGQYYNVESMACAYNTVDCAISVSLQEGLNWTIVESMLCGTPVIASNTTAHTELLEDGAGLLVNSDAITFLPVVTAKGTSWVDALAVNYKDLIDKMWLMATDEETRKSCTEKGLKRGAEWVNGADDINLLILDTVLRPKNLSFKKEQKDSVLFAQHSSGGDVLMTTRCLEDIRKRHQDKTLVYMTSPQYMDIVAGNPYIDKVIPWDDKAFSSYKIVYNPHGDRILPGHWGRNSNSILSDFYWKILLIDKPCDFYVGKVKPSDNEIVNKITAERRDIVILQTTGGDPEFRSYLYMEDVANELWKMGLYTIQLGGKNDEPAGAMLDLRGKLSFRESNWVASKASYAVTIDSYMSHLCGALGTPQICLFGSGNHYVVKPNQIKGRLICMTPDYVKYCAGLGPCSGGVRDCPVKCTGVHDPKDIINNFKSLMLGGEYE